MTERRVFKIGDLVRLNSRWPINPQDLDPLGLVSGDVGVVVDTYHSRLLITFARVGPDPAPWSQGHYALELVDTTRG